MLYLNEEQLTQKERAHQFAERITAKRVAMGDPLSIDKYRKLWKEYASFGLMMLPIPQEDGGLGEELLGMMAISEGMGCGSKEAGFMFSINAHIWACLLPIHRFGNNEQKQTYLQPMMNGDCIGAHAISEPEAGSDIFNLTTSFSVIDDGFILNGSKTFVTNAPVADLFLVYARAENTKGIKGISCFLIDKGTVGLSVGKTIPKMGLDLSFFSMVYLDDCFAPKNSRLGHPNGGISIFNYSMDYERPFLFSFQIGLMEKQLQLCHDYSKMRKQYKKPIIEFQSISNRLADMKVRLEVSRLLCYQIAEQKQRNKPSTVNSSIAKLFISEAVVDNSMSAMEIYGAYGYTKEYGIERNLRDSLAGKFYSGTSDIQRNIIANLM